LTTDHPDDRHTNLRQNGKYVVIGNFSESPGLTYEILYDGLGIGYGDVSQTSGRFQPVYVSNEVRAFTVVEGAMLNVTGSDGENVTAKTTVDIEGESVSYERHGTVSDGTAEIRVAHPGEYKVASKTVTVSEAAVYDGGEIRIDPE
jgi:dolichyl-diphosphooligosaccharide--protein glycosyltransferase